MANHLGVVRYVRKELAREDAWRCVVWRTFVLWGVGTNRMKIHVASRLPPPDGWVGVGWLVGW